MWEAWWSRVRRVSWRVLVVPRSLTRRVVVLGLLPLLVGDAAARQPSLTALEPRLGQADEARVGHGGAIRVRHLRRDAHVNPHRQARRGMADASLHLEDELRVVAIRPA
jgi:hypothetical protein